MLEELTTHDPTLVDTIRKIAHPLQEGNLTGYDPLLDLVGDARIVLLGEASHGTHEFYRERTRITTRLIQELDRFLLLLKHLREERRANGFNDWRGQRAIGVVYHPEYEAGNYVPTRLADRYDAYIHIDRTSAVRPLNIEPIWTGPLEQTYPSGY